MKPSHSYHRLGALLAVPIALAFCLGPLGLASDAPTGRWSPRPPHHSASSGMVSLAHADPISITVHGQRRFQTMASFGASERVFNDPHLFNNFNPTTRRAETIVPATAQNAILDNLYRDMRLTRIKPIIDPGIEPLNNNQFFLDWKRTDAHIRVVRRALHRGAAVYFLSPLSLEAWMRPHGPDAASNYVQWAMSILRYWRSKGLNTPYYSLVNESGRSDLSIPATFIRDVIKKIGLQLRVEGFQTRFVITDDINPAAAAKACRAMLVDPIARKYVGALVSHLYGASDGSSARSMALMKSLSVSYKLPLWMTEFSRGETKTSGLDWAVPMQDLIVNENVSAIDYLWAFFGDWQQAVSLIYLHNDGPRYTGYTFDPAYYAMGQFSKFVRPGMRRVGADSNDPAVKVAAFRQGSASVVIVIHTASTAIRVKLQLEGFHAIHQLDPVQTTEEGAEKWAYLPPVQVPAATIALALPARSITTLVSRR